MTAPCTVTFLFSTKPGMVLPPPESFTLAVGKRVRFAHGYNQATNAVAVKEGHKRLQEGVDYTVVEPDLNTVEIVNARAGVLVCEVALRWIDPPTPFKFENVDLADPRLTIV